VKRVVLAGTAEAELEAIGDRIAQDSPARALAFVAELKAACDGLAEHPERFPVAPRYAGFGVRRRAHRDYLIFYRVGPETVEIIHVLHGACDVEEILAIGEPPRRPIR
jgi:plasmid stabilization system protein ParE